MQESKDRKATAQKNESKERLSERKSEATSDETLSDLQETEKDSNSTDTGLDPGPSPDGMLDEPDEIKHAGRRSRSSEFNLQLNQFPNTQTKV